MPVIMIGISNSKGRWAKRPPSTVRVEHFSRYPLERDAREPAG
jgi:hypothetical protein